MELKLKNNESRGKCMHCCWHTVVKDISAYKGIINYSLRSFLLLKFHCCRNVGQKTIEEDIMVALKKLDIVNDEEFAKQQLVNFQRAARTDKGVSALRQVINLNMSKVRIYLRYRVGLS